MTLAQLERFGDEKCLRVQHRFEPGLQLMEMPPRTGDKPGFQQRGLHGHVARGFLDAMRSVAHAGADFQTAVPTDSNETFDPVFELRVAVGVGVVGQQQQHVDI